MAWTPKYPNGCVSCGTTDKKHLGRGLCTTCYQREARSVETSETFDPDNGSRASVNGPNSDRDSSSGLQDEEASPGVETPPYVSERRPGTNGPSIPDGDPGDAPNPPKGFRKLFGKKDKPAPPPPKSTNERRPGKRSSLGRRQSTADTLEDILSGVGAVAMRTGKHYPLGRYLQFSAPVSAEIVDEALNGTVVDRVILQPIVKGRGRFDGLAAVFGPPAIIVAIENNPERAPLLIPVLKTSIRNSLPMMAKAIKKVQAKERAMAEAAAELFPDLPDGADPADAIIAMIFEGWTPPEPASVVEDEPVSEPSTVDA